MIHWLPVSKLTQTQEIPPWEKALRAYLHSPEGKKAAHRSAPKHRARISQANTPIRGLPANRRHGVRLIG